MTISYVAGFDISDSNFELQIGSAGETTIIIKYTGSGESDTYYLDDYDANASSLYCHVDIHSMETRDGETPLSSTWADASLASLLSQALNAGATGEGWAGVFLVSYVYSTCKYIISYSAADIALAVANAETGRILGYNTGVHSGSQSHVSDNTCKYAIAATLGNISRVSDEYEPSGGFSLAISDGGYPIAMSRTTPIVYFDWHQEFESREKTFIRRAASTAPWTYQHLFEHCRTIYPLVVCSQDNPLYSGYYPVVYLRGENAHFKPERDMQDYDGHWHIPFRSFLYGWTPYV